MSVQLSTVHYGMHHRGIINGIRSQDLCNTNDMLVSSGKSILGRSQRKKKLAYLVLCAASQHGKHVSLESKVGSVLDDMKWDEQGLAVAMAQNIDTGAILMQGFANKEALAATISSRKATFYSRSRSTLWTKGQTSSNFITVDDIFLDCDGDSIIYLGQPSGPACHTGSKTCFYKSVLDAVRAEEVDKQNTAALTTLYSLEHTIASRKAELARSGCRAGKPSWTSRLLLDHALLCSKIREEADELCRTLEEDEDGSRAASEMADVIYHAMVLLALKDVAVEDVMQVLRRRFYESGIEEKIGRSSTPPAASPELVNHRRCSS